MKKKGLTLLEILISSLILAVVMAGMANVFLAAKRHIVHSLFRIKAAETAKYQLNRLQMQVRQDEWSNNCLGAQSGCTSSMYSYGTNWVFNWTTEDVSGMNLRRVELKINWAEAAF